MLCEKIKKKHNDLSKKKNMHIKWIYLRGRIYYGIDDNGKIMGVNGMTREKRDYLRLG